MTYEYKATLVRVVDGDTVDLDVDLGFRAHLLVRFRVLGIDAPELRGDQKEAGAEAKAALGRILAGRDLWIESHKTDKYGRWLAEIHYLDDEGKLCDAAETLITAGQATPYPAS